MTMSEAAAPAQAVQQKRPKKPLPELTGPQKAAAVVIALGAEKASNLYKYMDPEDVEQLTLEVARLGYLNSEQTESVLTEFTQMCMTNKAVTEGGLEYARSVLEKAYGEQAADDLLNKVTRTLKNREFAFMNKADVKSLYSALQNERPQTIALVLSYVEAEKAAGVVAQLEESKQVQVVENIARIESVSPAAIKIVEAEMSKKFSSILTSANVKVGGVDYVAAIMNNSVVQTNSATSEESAAASEELSSQASLMKELMAKFTLRSDKGYGTTSSHADAPADASTESYAADSASAHRAAANSFSKY